MDRKTLEQMEKQAIKAREIVDEIESLERAIERVANADEVDFSTNELLFCVNVTDKSTVKLLAETFAAIAKEEIQRLEQELAEL
ncbi:hypothetical protein J1P26_19885 [Neobacillus sp. MM2021_6]|uniref:hypothetical protein n=1 Tax=Bacillaceae TaxID=186817 RepID=UPI00140C9B42|nr:MULTISPECIES: hypothetical protein [Bacillaceae]MBO0961969.1 hypothetical protein [Neobacillus sp. MM2021_6]NHC20334.1 hypothetical protein [Bacillus sp. MM2020_4]